MSRQNKFRIWDKKRSFFDDELMITQDGGICCSPVGESLFFVARKNYVIQQWTGLLDVKGKDIYEGDIVEFYSGYPNQNDNSFYKSKSAVKFQNGAFWPRPIIDHNDEDDWYSYELKDLEVVGNIFENPLVD